MAGSLFVVATPIGNLEDLTFRALRTLREVDLIAAEDTRRTSKLLAHYGVAKPLVSLHEHNEYHEAPKLVARMNRGESIALVSDAGTPAISDPGATLVRLAREAGLRIVPVPGPSAIAAALSISGLPATPFAFAGFPPPSGTSRAEWFESFRNWEGVIVLFESPHRIERTIQEISNIWSNRIILINREISKINEESFIWEKFKPNERNSNIDKGEIVLVVSPMDALNEPELEQQYIVSLFDQISKITSLTEQQALTATAAALGIQEKLVKKSIKKERILVKRQIESQA